jgi:TonB family protein
MRDVLISGLARRLGPLLAAAAIAGVVTAPGRAQSTEEARLLAAVERRPDTPEPLIDLARFYTLALRLTEAEERGRQAQAALQRASASGRAAPPDRRANLAGRAVAMPSKTVHVNPTYPADAAIWDIEGIVLVDLIVRPDGKVGDVRVVRSIRGLDAAALAAVRQWEYDPDTVRSPSGSVVVPVMLGFTLSSDSETANQLDLAAWLVGRRRYADAERAVARALELIGKRREACRSDGPPRRAGGDILPPRKIKDVRPRYPAGAQRGRASGLVMIEALIGRTGTICSAVVLKSATPELDEAALRAVRRWEFAPSLVDGVPSPVLMPVTVSFNIGVRGRGSGI